MRGRLGVSARRAWLIVALAAVAGSGAHALDVSGVTVRAGLSYGFDGNAFEAVDADRRVSDAFGRLEADLERRPPGGRTGPIARLRMAAEHYADQPSQDRGLLLASLGWRQRYGPTVGELCWAGQLNDRANADSLDLRRNELTYTGAALLSRRTRLSWSAEGIWIDTEPGGPIPRSAWRLRGGGSRGLTPRLRADLRIEGGETRFAEPAIADWEAGTLRYAGSDQRDRDHCVGIALAWSGLPMVELSYGYRTIDSNSLGFSQHRQEASCSVGWLLPWSVSGQLLARWESPHYEEEGFRHWRLRDDPEDPDLGARSGVTLQLRRPLGRGLLADIQAGWQRNEARVSGRYYEKALILVGVRYELDLP